MPMEEEGTVESLEDRAGGAPIPVPISAWKTKMSPAFPVVPPKGYGLRRVRSCGLHRLLS